MFDKKMPFLAVHIQRLMAGMKVFALQNDDFQRVDFWKNEIDKIILQENQRIRLTVFRKEGGLYTPQNNEAEFIIETSPLTENHFVFSSHALSFVIQEESALQANLYSKFKTINALPYILAGIYKTQNQVEECILTNTKGNIVESISANIFIVNAENQIVTPPTNEGCIAGIMRSILINELQQDFDFCIKPITRQDFENASEIFTTNSIQGIKILKMNVLNIEKSIALILTKRLNLIINKNQTIDYQWIIY
jgi:branched-chain amino acid aminotransferase